MNRPSARSDRAVVRLAIGVFALVLGCTAAGVTYLVLNATRGPADVAQGGSTLLMAVVMVAFPVAGLVIATREPRNAVGWILLGIGLVWAVVAVADGYVRYGLITAPGSLPRPDVVAVLTATAWVPGVGLTGTFLLLWFPDGHLPSPRWRPFAWAVAGTLTFLTVLPLLLPAQVADMAADADVAARLPDVPNPLGVAALAPLLDHVIVLVIVMPLAVAACIVGSALSLIVRHRRARGLERLQLRWLAAAAAGTAVIFGATMVLSLIFGGEVTGEHGPPPGWLAALQALSPPAFALIPVAIAVAIRRHRLYEIDRLVSRTVAYALIVVLLAGVYAAGTAALAVVLPADSDLAVAMATLAVAAAFRPLERRIRHVVDRRFNRHRFDAEREAARFARVLRGQTDLQVVAAQLEDVIADTLQPASLHVWTTRSRAS